MAGFSPIGEARSSARFGFLFGPFDFGRFLAALTNPHLTAALWLLLPLHDPSPPPRAEVSPVSKCGSHSRPSVQSWSVAPLPIARAHSRCANHTLQAVSQS